MVQQSMVLLDAAGRRRTFCPLLEDEDGLPGQSQECGATERLRGGGTGPIWPAMALCRDREPALLRLGLSTRGGRAPRRARAAPGCRSLYGEQTSRGPLYRASPRRTMSPESSVDRDRPGIDPFRLHRLGHCRDAVYDVCPFRQAREQQPRSVGR